MRIDTSALVLAAQTALVTILAAGVAPAGAQEIDIGEIVVTPNRAPGDKAKTGSKVETVTKDDIAKQQKPAVLDYLTLVPGVHVANPGGAGQEASVSMRGADKKYIKTLFNGIDISDPTSTQVQTSYQHLLSGGVTAIEVLKGSQSTLYGSDAIAGVIGISTLGAIEPGVHHDVMIEAGSFETVRGGYTLSGADDTGKAAIGLYGLSTDGISAARVNGSNADTPPVDADPTLLESDAYRNVTATFAGEKRLSEQFSVFGSALLIKSDADYDDSGNPPKDNTNNVTRSTQKAGRVGFNLDLLDGRFRNTFSAQIFDIDRDLDSLSAFGPFTATYLGQRRKVDYQGAVDATDWATLQFGGDYEQQTADVTDNYGTDTSEEMAIGGVWGQLVLDPIDNLTLTAAYRHDEHSEFGGYGTYRFTGSYLFPTSTRLHASVGTGFRAPSLYELYAPGGTGNPDLQPEESLGFDIGIEQRFLDDRLVADVTYFQLDTENLIDYRYDSVFPDYYQTKGVTHRNGVEASLSWSATPWLDVGGAYTYTRTRQPDGQPRPRIPEHDIALTATVRPAEKWSVTATAHGVLNVTDRVGSGGSASNVTLKDYLLLDAKVAYKPTEKTEVYLRGENLLNQDYELVNGYGTPGAAVYAGFKATF